MPSDDPLTLQCAEALRCHEDEDTILELIEQGAELRELLDHIWDAVHIGSIRLVRALLDAGADAEGSAGRQSLELAAHRGYTEIVTALLELTPSHDQRTLREPLRKAILHGHHDTAARLVFSMTLDRARRATGTLTLPTSAYEDIVTKTFAPMVMVAFHGWDDVARRLLFLGRSPDERSVVVVTGETFTSYENVPALVAAVMGGHESMVRLLLDAGADPAAADGKGMTALVHAEQRGHAQIQRVLSGMPREVEPTANELLVAASDGDLARVERILAAGIKVDAVPEDGPHRGHSALGQAATNGDLALVSRLLTAGANVDHPRDRPPLVQAARKGHVEVIARLVDAGAELECRDREGCTPLLAAGNDEELAATVALLDAGADVDGTDVRGQTALFGAVASESLPRVEMLLARGANPRAIGRDGRSVLDDAREYLDPGPVLTRLERAVAEAEAAGTAVADGHPYREPLARLQKEIDAIDVSDYEYDAVLARLEAGVSAPAFVRVVERLQAELGVEPGPLTGYRYRPTLPGVRFDLPESVDPTPLADRYAGTGALVFALTEGRYRGTTSIAVLATDDLFEAMAAIRPAGPNYGVSAKDFLRWAIHVHRAHPFRLTYLHYDLVQGDFLQDLPDPMLMAERIYDICPDSVEQGHETVEALAASLAERHLFLWWD